MFQLGVLFVAGAVIISAILFRELRSVSSDVARSNQEEWSEAAALTGSEMPEAPEWHRKLLKHACDKAR